MKRLDPRLAGSVHSPGHDEIGLYTVRAVRVWRGHPLQRGVWRTWRHRDRSDAQPGVASAFSIALAVTVTVAVTRAGAKHSELHDHRHRPAVNPVGRERPLRVRGIDRLHVRVDGEQGRLVGGYRAGVGAGRHADDPGRCAK